MKDIFTFFEKKKKDTVDFNAVQISLAAPEQIRDWSSGEVKKPETINYRTFKPEKDGLFCARIFGPVKDYECLCGKYKRMKHRGIVCEKCGVEVISSKVRRERLAHIELATPVAHIWFLKSLPSRIGNLLDISLKDLEKVLYCVAYVVTDPGETLLGKGEVLSEQRYATYCDEFGAENFEVAMGADAIRGLLREIDIEDMSDQLRAEMKVTTSKAKRKRFSKRLKIVDAFRHGKNLPEWMVLEVIPVLPPDLRPLVPLDGGRFATSDLNDLYRRVINRNNRLNRLLELNAPEIIIRNEKRMLQESVDALFDNGRGGKTITGPNRRPLKSLSDMLRGKQGRFRQNLLGKRVDYSGRSVIVAGPELKLHQCGIPKKMALELYKPFIYHWLQKEGVVSTIKSAKKLVEKGVDEVWDALDEVILEHPVLLNRAPTLHRLGIQAFEPVLIEGKAIQIHPLVCSAYNADFDGDQMAVHLPLSIEAQMEARVLLLSTNNILSPAHGKPIIGPTQDIVLGCYWMTRERAFAQGEGRRFSSPTEVRAAYDADRVHVQAKIKCRIDGEMYDTTVGRVLFSDILPEGVPFTAVNKVLKKGDLAHLIDLAYDAAGEKATVLFADRMRTMGYTFATRAGITIGLDDMVIPDSKWSLLNKAQEEVQQIDKQMQQGALTAGERYNKVVDIWAAATEEVADEMMTNIEQVEIEGPEGEESVTQPSFNSIFMMADSKARGSAQQMKQLSGMRGMMAKPSGEIIETPITANFREGLTGLEYFISTHGARKGLADTALKTASSGYLTRKLVDVAQDATIVEPDCGTLDGMEVTALYDGGDIVEELTERIIGRYTLEPVWHPTSDEVIVEPDTEITQEVADRIEAAGLEKVVVRSPLTCASKRGICSRCYGRDLARGRLVNVGEAVGIIAAQSIGEPGTQLTMRTFHFGGIGTLQAQASSIQTRHGGTVRYEDLRKMETDRGLIVMNRNARLIVESKEKGTRESFPLNYGALLQFDEGEEAEQGATLAKWDPYSNPFLAGQGGRVRFEDIIPGVTMDESVDQTTFVSRMIITESKDQNAQPKVHVVDSETDKVLQTVNLPSGAVLEVTDKEEVKPGQVLAKVSRETMKNKDITGGLPRVAELFEARKPKDLAEVSEIDGIVKFGRETKNKRYIDVVPEFGETRQYRISKSKHIIVQDGDYVRAQEPLTEGSVNPHDILAISGKKELANYLLDEIQQVYRLQGVRIHDKHIETIIRQMLRRVRVKLVGDTNFLVDQNVDREIFEDENKRVVEAGGEPAVAEDLLLGIAKASLSTESFISAASFQETTKVLTEAALNAKIDYLRGLKENVIMGRLIPAGTGMASYRNLGLELVPETGEEDEEEEEPVAAAE
jgi:DNA-directed RNA polymerase subunit beta'